MKAPRTVEQDVQAAVARLVELLSTEGASAGAADLAAAIAENSPLIGKLRDLNDAEFRVEDAGEFTRTWRDTARNRIPRRNKTLKLLRERYGLDSQHLANALGLTRRVVDRELRHVSDVDLADAHRELARKPGDEAAAEAWRTAVAAVLDNPADLAVNATARKDLETLGKSRSLPRARLYRESERLAATTGRLLDAVDAAKKTEISASALETIQTAKHAADQLVEATHAVRQQLLDDAKKDQAYILYAESLAATAERVREETVQSMTGDDEGRSYRSLIDALLDGAGKHGPERVEQLADALADASPLVIGLRDTDDVEARLEDAVRIATTRREAVRIRVSRRNVALKLLHDQYEMPVKYIADALGITPAWIFRDVLKHTVTTDAATVHGELTGVPPAESEEGRRQLLEAAIREHAYIAYSQALERAAVKVRIETIKGMASGAFGRTYTPPAIQGIAGMKQPQVFYDINYAGEGAYRRRQYGLSEPQRRALLAASRGVLVNRGSGRNRVRLTTLNSLVRAGYAEWIEATAAAGIPASQLDEAKAVKLTRSGNSVRNQLLSEDT